MPNPNDHWEGSAAMNKALKALATSVRPISASRVKTAAATALDNVKVNVLSPGWMTCCGLPTDIIYPMSTSVEYIALALLLVVLMLAWGSE